MKRIKIYIFIALVFSVLLSSCAYKRYTKEAVRYEQSGMYSAAVDRYMEALVKKADYIEARLGLMRSAVTYADELQQKIDVEYAALNDNGVVDNYLLLENLKQKAQVYQVDVPINSRTTGQYIEAKNRYLVEHYAAGQQNVNADHFSEALVEFEKVAAVNSTYENVEELIKYCKCEPLYRLGEQQMKVKKYRTAYATFGKLIGIDAVYKDVVQLRAEAVQKGVLTVAYSNVEIARPTTSYQSFVDKVLGETTNKVQKANNPFLRIVELNQNAKLIEQQKRAMANNLDFNTGQIVPVRALLSCRLSSLAYTKSRLEKIQKKGFIKIQNEDKSYTYKKVYYYEYQQNAVLSASFSYNIISTETGLVILSGVCTPRNTDNIRYVRCPNYNVSQLYSGNWESLSVPFNAEKDVVYENITAKNAFAVLKNGRSTLKTSFELETPLINSISTEMSRKMLNYNPE